MLKANRNSIGASKAENFRYFCNIWILCHIVSVLVRCGCHIWCSTPYQDFESNFSDNVGNVLALISLTPLLGHQCIRFSNRSWIVAKMKGFESDGCVRQRVLTASVIIVHCSGLKVIFQRVRQFSALVLSWRSWSRSKSWVGGCFAFLVHSEKHMPRKDWLFRQEEFLCIFHGTSSIDAYFYGMQANRIRQRTLPGRAKIALILKELPLFVQRGPYSLYPVAVLPRQLQFKKHQKR